VSNYAGNKNRILFTGGGEINDETTHQNCFFLRPFGTQIDDLEIDFGLSLRTNLITDILYCCIESATGDKPSKEFLEQLPTGKRIEALIAIPKSERSGGLKVQFHCPDESCKELMELEILPEEIASISELNQGDAVEVTVNDKILQFRRPTGTDQIGWAGKRFPDRKSAVKQIIQTLLVNDNREAEVEEIINNDDSVRCVEEALVTFDPLINFSISTNCTVCGRSCRLAVNLETLALDKLQSAQENLLHTVHRLAAHYNWSERQILAIPHWRRVKYLDMMENEVL
jgi:hypothetical protein